MQVARALGLIAAAFALTGATLAEKEARAPKATFQSEKAAADLVACLVPAVSWMSVPSVSGEGEGRTRIVSDVSGVIVLAMMVTEGSGTTVDVRTKVPGRLRRSIEGCL